MAITRERQFPIIQDGKLVGAVTHVPVNDPTRGCGFLRKICRARQDKSFGRGISPLSFCGFTCYNKKE